MPKIEIPDDHEVELQLAENGPAHPVMVLDVDPEAILVRVPASWADMAPPERVVLSYGHAGAHWRVPTSPRATYDAWWFLDRPEEAPGMRTQRRGLPRVRHQTTIFVSPAGTSGETLPVRTIDFGPGGCLVESMDALGQSGDRVLVALALPGQPTVTTTSELVWVRSAPGGPGGHYALKFAELEPADRDRLTAYVEDLIARSAEQGRDITVPEPHDE